MRFLQMEAVQVMAHAARVSQQISPPDDAARKETAKVAMANKLAVRLYWMMRQGWNYQQWSKFSSHADSPTLSPYLATSKHAAFKGAWHLLRGINAADGRATVPTLTSKSATSGWASRLTTASQKRNVWKRVLQSHGMVQFSQP